MKKVGKNQPAADSYSVTEAAAALGVSTPTLKRMVAEGRLESFRTPGGHLRILTESLEAVRDNRQTRSRPAGNVSPVLQNRRERLEELTLETQEHRARRELTKLQREEQEEAERLEAEAQAREDEVARRQAEIDLERERLEHEKAQERRRQERERAEAQALLEAEEELAAFRERWYALAAQALDTSPKLAWLTAPQRKEVTDALEAEIERRQPADEPRMAAILARSLAALVEPLMAERDAQERRHRVTTAALWGLPYSAADAEKLKATAAIREALGRLDSSADANEMRVAAQEAIRPFCQAIERRQLDARLISWALGQLPWGRTAQDEASLRRECAGILADLPLDVSQVEATEALGPAVAKARQEIEQRQAEQQRQARKQGLIQAGLAELSTYLLRLKYEGEIADEDYWDADFNAGLRQAVRQGLEGELTGDESSKEAGELAREIVDGEVE